MPPSRFGAFSQPSRAGWSASVPGSLLGARLTVRLDERRLLQAVGAVLLVAGSAMIEEAIF